MRIQLIDRLAQLDEAHVQALADELPATPQNTSKHLAALWRAGLLARRREGRVTVYSLADRNAFELIEHVAGQVAAVTGE